MSEIVMSNLQTIENTLADAVLFATPRGNIGLTAADRQKIASAFQSIHHHLKTHNEKIANQKGEIEELRNRVEAQMQTIASLQGTVDHLEDLGNKLCQEASHKDAKIANLELALSSERAKEEARA